MNRPPIRPLGFQLLKGFLLLCSAGLFWLPVTFEEARTVGERNLGLPFLMATCLMFMIPIGVAGIVMIFKSVRQFSRRR
jgi:hypothetical protein